MKDKISYAQDILLDLAKELTERNQSIQHDPLDDEITAENKFATKRTLSAVNRKIYQKFDELEQYKK